MASPATDLRDRVSALVGMDVLLPALAGVESPCHLVGGAVRDLLRGERSVDLDLAVEGDAAAVARTLADRLDGRAVVHDRFGTATVHAERLQLDLARTRREVYPRPGQLPEVEPAPLAEDLLRRDFTVNAMAIGLSGEDLGSLHDPAGGRADLDAGRIRILHPQSFIEDPTRLLRAVRYESRLGFSLEAGTERLAREAAAGGALTTVSGGRIRDELIDLLAEPEAPRSVGRMAELGLGRALHPRLAMEPELVAGAQLGAAQTAADPALAALAAMCVGAAEGLAPWVQGLALGADARDAVLRAARTAPTLAEELRKDLRDSQLHELLEGEPPECLALALALGAPGEPVLRWLGALRSTRLEITGADLLAAGVAESPAVGLALRETLRRKLDGELSGREQELQSALELIRARP